MTHRCGGGLGLVARAVFKTAGRRPWRLWWVRFPHAPAMRPRNMIRTDIGHRILRCCAIISVLALGTSRVSLGQIPIPIPQPSQVPDSTGADTIQVPIFRIDPPVSPLGAAMRSLLLPGWGQAVLDRRVTGAFFVFSEGVTLTMTLKASHQLSHLEAIEAERVEDKRQEIQDWVVLLAFNHLLAAAEAYVSAMLWDFPAELKMRALPNGAFGLGLRVTPGGVVP